MLQNRLTTQEVLDWCSIPWRELETHELKTKLDIYPDKGTMMEAIGNMMADEVAANNAAGRPTKWVLPAGPTDEYAVFAERVNRERIDCTNLWVFHMDEFLDWQGRPYPVADTYESLEGTMIACFYDKIDPELRPGEDHRIWPRIDDIDAADAKCAELGGIDTVWAGIGATGLVAFNEAPRSFCRRITVEEYAVAIKKGQPELLAVLNKVIDDLDASGSWKKTVWRVLLLSEPTVEYPVTILPAYIPDVTLMTDENTIDHPLSHEIRGW